MEGFRTLIRGWFGKVLLALFLVPFALVGIEGYFQRSADSNEVAEVGDQTVSTQEFNQALNEQKQRLLGQVNQDENRLNHEVLKTQVLKNLVDRAVLLNQAKVLGFVFSQEQIADIIRKEPTFQDEKGVFSEQKFQDFLKSTGQDRNTLLAKVQQQVSLQQLVGGLNNSALGSTIELERLIKLQGEKRVLHVLDVPVSNYFAQVNITDKQIADHYNKNKTNYSTQTTVDAEYLVLNQQQLAANITTPDEANLQQRYQARLSQFKSNTERHAQHILISVDEKTKDVDAKKKADELFARLQKGEDFATLAKQFSQDPGSAISGGDLGFAAKGTYVPEFEAELDALQPNQISKPVKTQFGYHLIKLLEVRTPDAPTFETLKPELIAEAQKEQKDQQYADAVNKLNELAAESTDLTALAKAYNLTIERLPAHRKNQPYGALNSQAELDKVAFSDDMTQDSHISTGIAITPEQTVWLQVTKYQPSRSQTLKEASLRIKSALLIERARQLAGRDAQKIVDAINAGQAPADVSKAFNVQFNDLGEIGRMNGLPDAAVQSAAFALSNPPANQWRAAVVNNAKTGVNVIAVSQVIAGDVSSLPADQRKQMRSMLSSVHGQQEAQDYVEYLRSQVKIKTHLPKDSAAQ